ncbi:MULTISPECIES: hypothetical protein [unclassified Burkholderia]|uniref:hypothetical protein n=1 Tax=unclassified Burkholderia TaxID=2613784 RepID=UPI00162881D8|nr:MULTISPECIES: hypothetical protein [unclassified Burkholderia]
MLLALCVGERVRMTTSTLASLRTPSPSCANSYTVVLPVNALRVSAWLMVTVRMPPSRLVVREAILIPGYQKISYWRFSSNAFSNFSC